VPTTEKPVAVRWRVRQSRIGGWSSATMQLVADRFWGARGVSMLMLSSVDSVVTIRRAA
jgi:hypothetical protein